MKHTVSELGRIVEIVFMWSIRTNVASQDSLAPEDHPRLNIAKHHIEQLPSVEGFTRSMRLNVGFRFIGDVPLKSQIVASRRSEFGEI
jgi:hypothetical protein